MIPLQMMKSTETILIDTLSTLPPPHLSRLTTSISAIFHRHGCRLVSLLSSPILFSLTLRHLQSLTLPQKSLLIARHLQSNLALLKEFTRTTTLGPPPYREIDAALLLLLICEFHHYNPDFLHAPPSHWRVVLCDYYCNSILSLTNFGEFSTSETLIRYIESIWRCRSFVGIMGCQNKEGSEEEAASAEAVVALPSVEVNGGECVICKEEMMEGREVCKLPCTHLFHWVCILRWLKKRNTCPCCRYRLPTDNAYREIERIMENLTEIGGGSYRACL